MAQAKKTKPASGAGAEKATPKAPHGEGIMKGAAMDAEQVLNRLREGNKRYMAGELQPKDVKAKREGSLEGQKPFATVVACSDSRVEPVYIFDTNIEEIFNIQTAGNIVDDITIGSIEYAVAHLHTPVVMVLGHEKCGAVTAAYEGHREGNITKIMEKIDPVIKDVERTDDKAADVVKCAEANVKAVMTELMEKSQIVRDAVQKGETKLVGAMYYLGDGHVELIA
jgi:carbonic anhydrase